MAVRFDTIVTSQPIELNLKDISSAHSATLALGSRLVVEISKREAWFGQSQTVSIFFERFLFIHQEKHTTSYTICSSTLPLSVQCDCGPRCGSNASLSRNRLHVG